MTEYGVTWQPRVAVGPGIWFLTQGLLFIENIEKIYSRIGFGF